MANSSKERENTLVYSTEQGRICPSCSRPKTGCTCTKHKKNTSPASQTAGPVHLRFETKGRKGNGVTIISRIAADEEQLRTLCKTLKSKCGAGGSVKDATIIIQGDHREKLHSALVSLGYRCKTIGQ